MLTFEKYWSESPLSTCDMPGALKEAMREIAVKAWNTALDNAVGVVNAYESKSSMLRLLDRLQTE